MISKTQQCLNELFNVDPIPENTNSALTERQLTDVTSEDYLPATEINDDQQIQAEDEQFKRHIEIDHNTVRTNLQDLLNYSETLLDLAIRTAQDTENPKSIESAAKLIGQMADINIKLLDATAKKQDVYTKTRKASSNNKFNQLGFEQGAVPVVNQVTNNTMFVGTAADLAKMLKQVREEQEITINENSITN